MGRGAGAGRVMLALLLRLDAPLVSFGSVAVDNRRPVQEYPPLSLLAGLLGNALGYDHRDADKLQRLQDRIRYGSRCDRRGAKLTDFQTVELGQEHLAGTGWTTRGEQELRRGASSEATHIRYREYWADSVHTMAVALQPADEDPDVERLQRALLEPERPLFIGRKACLPAGAMVLGLREVSSLRGALEVEPRIARERWDDPASVAPLSAWLPEGEAVTSDSRQLAVTDERDWSNQVVVGRRIVLHTRVNPPEARDAR